MPLINSDFHSPWWLVGGHLQTLLPSFLRFVSVSGHQVGIDLSDGDRLSAELYLHLENHDKRPLIILTHGLEGHARQPYILGMVKAALVAGYDVLAWNLRGCGVIDNLSEKLYHSGSSEDLDAVICWGLQQGYTDIFLAGYSLGGNITLKWLGEKKVEAVRLGVKAVCTASVPVDLADCVATLDRGSRWIYRQRFLRDMKRRLRAKAKKFPNTIDLSNIDSVTTMYAYDDVYSGPLNGFHDAKTYHELASAKKYLSDIAVPCLLVNSLNDPFFGKACMPRAVADKHSFFTLEISTSGGHVGYFNHSHQWWLDQRFLAFFAQHQAKP